MSRSALVVEVPEAEPVVGAHRLRLDAQAALGVPAHVTALFPFVTADAVGPDVVRALDKVAARHEPFEARFSTTAWFGDDVLYLAPDEPEPFLGLTHHLTTRFPDHPPYGGAFEEPTPHLTVGHGHGRDVLRAAERDIVGALPVRCRVHRLTLMVEAADGRWARAHAFALGRR